MKIYPLQLEKLLDEPAIPSRFATPASLQKTIVEFQELHQKSEGGHKLTIPEITVLAIAYGMKQMKKDNTNFRIKLGNTKIDKT